MINDYTLILVIGLASLVAIWKVIKFFIILANPDNLPGFNLFKTWWR